MHVTVDKEDESCTHDAADGELVREELCDLGALLQLPDPHCRLVTALKCQQ